MLFNMAFFGRIVNLFNNKTKIKIQCIQRYILFNSLPAKITS